MAFARAKTKNALISTGSKHAQNLTERAVAEQRTEEEGLPPLIGWVGYSNATLEREGERALE